MEGEKGCLMGENKCLGENRCFWGKQVCWAEKRCRGIMGCFEVFGVKGVFGGIKGCRRHNRLFGVKMRCFGYEVKGVFWECNGK